MQWVPNEKKEQPEEEPVCVAFIRTYVGKDEDGIEIWKEEPLYTTPPEPKPHVWFKTDNGWRKEAFEKTLVKNVPLDTTPPKPHVWFDFSNCDKYRSKEEFEKTLLNTVPQREWVGLDDEDMKELRDADFDLLYGARWAEQKLRKKNGG